MSSAATAQSPGKEMLGDLPCARSSSIVRRPEQARGVAYHIGDHDHFFSLAQTRHTRDLLQANGFDVHYVELRGRDHSFRDAVPDVIEDAWRNMRRYTLPGH